MPMVSPRPRVPAGSGLLLAVYTVGRLVSAYVDISLRSRADTAGRLGAEQGRAHLGGGRGRTGAGLLAAAVRLHPGGGGTGSCPARRRPGRRPARGRDRGGPAGGGLRAVGASGVRPGGRRRRAAFAGTPPGLRPGGTLHQSAGLVPR